MSSSVASGWREKASGFFSNSSEKLRQASQSAGTFVGEVAKDAGSKASEAAERASTALKSQWSHLQQSRQQNTSQLPQDSMQERILSAAASTNTLLKRSLSETKHKVVNGKIIVEEVAKKTAQKGKTMITNIERWQKGVASTDAFGVPIEVLVLRQQSSRPIPQILVKCADYLVIHGLTSESIFKFEGDRRVIQHLISIFNEDWNASLPEGVNPIDVAALFKFYLLSLPEPLVPISMYNGIKDAGGNLNNVKDLLKRLPNVNHATIEFVTALLLKVSEKSSINKMDAHSLALEFAPVLFWQDKKPNVNENPEPKWNPSRMLKLNNSAVQPKMGTMSNVEQGFFTSNGKNINDLSEFDDLFVDSSENDQDIDAASQIPLDDGIPAVDYVIVELIQCLIERHSLIFMDVGETIWN